MKASLTLLGRPRLERSDGTPVVLPAKAFVLAAQIVLDCPDRETTRAAAAAFLWEATSQQRRRSGNLRQLIQRIQTAQSEGGVRVFVFEDDRIRVDRAVGVDLDLMPTEIAPTDGDAIYALGRLFRGELLAGVDEDGPEFAQWLMARRERLRDVFVRIVAPLVDADPPRLTDEQTTYVAHRLAEIDPCEEAGYRGLIRLHGRRGDAEAVQRTFRQLQNELERIVDAKPSEATRAVFMAATRRLTPSREVAAFGSSPAFASLVGRIRPLMAVHIRIASFLTDAEAELARAHVDECVDLLWRSHSVTVMRSDDEPGMPSRPFAGCDYRLDLGASRSEDRLVLRFQLRATATGEVLWSSKAAPEHAPTALTRAVEDIQRYVEIGELSASDQPVSVERQVHRLTLQGERWLKNIELPSVRRAKSLFRSALNSRDEYAPALAGLSRAFRMEWLLLTRGDMTELETAETWAKKAIAADPDDARGAHEMGICQIYRRRFDHGLELLERAAGSAPANVAIAEDLADARVMSGMIDQGIAQFDALLARLPYPSDQLLWYAAGGFYLAGDYDRAIGLLDRMVMPDTAFHLRAACHAMLNQRAEAEHFVRAMRDRLPDFRIGSRSHMAPLRRPEDREHFEAGLMSAGFDR
jgi:DNA-binding SARP family transcriptional activator